MKSDLERDLAANRAWLRQAHSRVVRKATSLLACEQMQELDCLSPAWGEAIGLQVALEEVTAAERQGADLLGRVTEGLAESAE